MILRTTNGVKEEPFETLRVEVPSDKLGPVMEMTGARRGELLHMEGHGEYTFVDFIIPARGLIGLRTKMLNATQGTAVIHHRFAGYRPVEGEIPSRPNGVMISMVAGKAVAFGLNTLQERADMFVCHGNVIRYLVARTLGVDSKAWTAMSVGHSSMTTIRVDRNTASGIEWVTKITVLSVFAQSFRSCSLR